jgi:uncharacterized protein (TIGR03435 family)
MTPFARAVSLVIPLGLALGDVALSAQAPRPSFEVASIKKQDERIIPPGPQTGRSSLVTFYRMNATVASLVQFAYDIRAFQVIGGPDWARKDYFEINARPANEAAPERMRLMVQSLLEDRFKLVVRREQREMRTSALVLAREDRRLGPKLQPCTNPDRQPEPRPVRVPRGSWVENLRCVPISAVVKMAGGITEGPVEDKTGLTGLWTLELSYATEAEAEAPPFQTALQDQLGLKLESTRGPVDVMVIASVQQPTEN